MSTSFDGTTGDSLMVNAYAKNFGIDISGNFDRHDAKKLRMQHIYSQYKDEID